MKNFLLSLFGSPGSPEKSSFNGNLSAFLICLLLSAFCWFLIVLSRQYAEKSVFKTEYINLPKDKALVNRLPDSLRIEISTSGFSMLRERIFRGSRNLRVDCSRLRFSRDSIGYLITNEITGELVRQLGTDYAISRIYPDTLFFNFGARSSRLVPVKLNISIGFEKQYQLSDSIKIQPSKVMIFGAKEAVDKIDYVYTNYLVLDKLDKTVVKKLGFAGDDRGLGYSFDSVKVTIPVDKFTEGNMAVPVEVINLPAGYTLKLFPDKVNVRYMVGISSLGLVSPAMFRVAIDYTRIAENSTRLKVVLLRAPSCVNSVKIDPDKVEFIIRKP